MQKLSLVFLISILYSTLAFGEEFQCTTRINGHFKQLSFNYDDSLYDNYTLREEFFRGWDVITCPAIVTLRSLTPELTDKERSPFCLIYDKENQNYTGYTLGESNAYWECKKPTKSACQRINESKEAAIGLASTALGLSGGATAAANAAGVSAVAHSSGAVILTGSSGYIAGTLATFGSVALAVLTAPATLTTAAVSAVAVGGAVYICKDDEN